MTASHFCTYFDRNYLFRGLALYRSMASSTESFTLWVLCFDQQTRRMLEALSLPGVCLIDLDEFEAADPALLGAKAGRKPHEYMWTSTPSLLLYILRKHPEVDTLTYLDADLFVYSDLRSLADELGGDSVLLVEHGYSRPLAYLAEITGIYNVGLMMFRNDESAVTALRWWRDRCLEWCFEAPEEGKFGDQKYLDEWPVKFPGVRVLGSKGSGLAPWNMLERPLSYRGGKIYVDSDELVFYHFHSLKLFGKSLYGLMHGSYSLASGYADLLYLPYIRELQSVIRLVQSVDPDFRFGYAAFNWRELARSARHHKLLWVPPAGKASDIVVGLQLKVGVVS